MSARVPVRKKGHGEVPVPGDTDDYEWTGYIPFEQLPQALNPESGLIVTANARVTGPDYKPYLTDRWEEPYRTARIFDLLQGRHDLRPEDMLKVQNDTYSYPHMFLAEQLSAAAKSAPPKDARAQHLIRELKDWNGIASADSVDVSFLQALRRSLLEMILEPYLGNNTDLYEWRSMAFLQRVLTDRPAKWLPPSYKNYDELLSAAADRAVSKLAAQTKSQRPKDWSWKRFNSLQMLHPMGQTRNSQVALQHQRQTAVGNSLQCARCKQATRPVGALCRQSRQLGRLDTVDHLWGVRATRKLALHGSVFFLV